MVTTTEILPAPVLQNYVRCYTLREFNTMSANLSKPLPAVHEFSITFLLSGSLYTGDTHFKNLAPAAKEYIIGLQTELKGVAIFNGEVKLFSIQFQPSGFTNLFGIPSKLITDNIFTACDIIDGVHVYKEQLNEALTLYEIKKLTDKFLTSFLFEHKAGDPYHSITSTSSSIVEQRGNVNIKDLAYQANMSLKRFEVRFTEQVGISPKLFARITRFNYALIFIMKNTSKSWSDVAYHCGYYDQMHFIKEFKEFAGNTPANFYKKTPLPIENFKIQ